MIGRSIIESDCKNGSRPKHLDEKDLIKMSDQKRIKITIPVKTVELKRFVEKAIREDEFFSSALENPYGAMKECGITFDLLAPADFAAFFGALAGVKEMVRKNNIKDLTFEGIFGRPADIHDTSLPEVYFADQKSETSSGSRTEWRNQDAIREIRSTEGWNKNFREAGLEDIFAGPLIDPVDLAALAAKIKAFTEIVEEVGL